MNKVDTAKWKNIFKNHIATFNDYGNIKIIDFKKPDSIEYRIRFIFEDDYYRLHISGDMGELIAINYYNMTYDDFIENYVNDSYYFEEKIICMNRGIYFYDEDKAKEDILNLFKEEFKEDDEFEFLKQYGYFDVQSALDYLLEDFGVERGLTQTALRELQEWLDYDYCDIPEDIGRIRTNILDVYLLAFQLAYDQINTDSSSKQ